MLGNLTPLSVVCLTIRLLDEIYEKIGGRMRKPERPSRWVPALESYSGTSQTIREAWKAFEVGVSPGEGLTPPLTGHQGGLVAFEVGVT